MLTLQKMIFEAILEFGTIKQYQDRCLCVMKVCKITQRCLQRVTESELSLLHFHISKINVIYNTEFHRIFICMSP